MGPCVHDIDILAGRKGRRGEERKGHALSFKSLAQKCTHHFWFYLLTQIQKPGQHLAARESGKLTFIREIDTQIILLLKERTVLEGN